MPEDKEFLDQLKTHPGGFGSIIKNLISDSPRLLLNFPIIGRARKISTGLEDEPFSILYKYERTLSNKLHPFLYRHNLNYITNGRIEGFFNKKFSSYEALLPQSLDDIRGSSYDEKLAALSSLRRIITSMAGREGHFMVIKFYDYIYSIINRSISDFLRSIEFKLNYLKPRLTEDDESNLNLVRKKYREFKNIFNDHDAELLIERMKWDPLLAKYALLIEKEEETGQDGSAPSGKIERYASLLKKKHLDHLEENDTDGIRRVIEAVTRSNEEQHGELKASSIIGDIINTWLNMDSLSENKKASIQSISGISSSDSENPEHGAEETAVQPTLSESLSGEEMADEIFQDTGLDDLSGPDNFSDSEEGSFSVADELLADDLSGFEITEESDSELVDFDITADISSEADGSFDIADEPDSGTAGDISITENEDSELADFDITAEDSSGPGGSFDVAVEGSPETGDDFIIDPESENEMKKLFTLVEKNISRLTESTRLKADAFDLSTLQAQEISTILNSEILKETRPGFLAAMEHSGDDVDLFLRIIRYLENGPFPEMTLRERICLMDIFIEKFKKNSDLTEKLTIYRNTMSSRQSLLDEVFTSLYTIKTNTPDKTLSINKQLQYLGERLIDDDYSPVWKTLQILYENIATTDSARTCSLLSETLPGTQVELFNQIKTIDETPELHERVNNMLASEKLSDGNERYIREQEKSPDSLEEIIRQVMKEDIDLESWIEKVGSEPQGDRKTDSTISLPVDTAEAKDRIKKMLSRSDWSEADTKNEFAAILQSLISHEGEKSLHYMEKILSHSMVPDEARETVLEAFRDSSTPLLQDAYTAHRLLETSPSTEKEADIINRLMQHYGESLPRRVIDDMKKFVHIRAKNREGGKKVQEILKGENGDLHTTLSTLAADTTTAPELQNSFTKLKEQLTAGNIEDAIRVITGSSSPPDLKIDLLEKLKNITINKNVSTDDPLIQKIDKKISFYKVITGESEKSRKQFTKNSDKLISNLGKRSSKQTNGETVPSPKKEKKPSTEETPESEENSLLNSTYNLLKVFSDNIDSLDPVLGTLKHINRPDHHQFIDKEIQDIKQNENRILSATLEMIDTGELNIELLQEIQKIPPRAQYLWAAHLQEKKDVKKFENAFSNFIKNKKLPDELNRLVRVIYSNNQNNFLKDSLDREHKLINDIAADFTTEGLNKLRSKTRNRQDKDKINLFRDLLKMSGDAIDFNAAASPLSAPPASPGKGIKSAAEMDTGHDGAAVTPSKKYKDNTVEKIQIFLSSYNSKSDKVRQASQVQIKDINVFFQKAAARDEQTLGVINQHPKEFTELFSYILRQKQEETFPEAKKVIKHCLNEGIIKREDL